MSWTNPKTSWKPGDGIKANDMNRIEGNIDHMFYDAISIELFGRTPYFSTTLQNGVGIVIDYAKYVPHHPGERLFPRVEGLAALADVANLRMFWSISPAPIPVAIGLGESGHPFVNRADLPPHPNTTEIGVVTANFGYGLYERQRILGPQSEYHIYLGLLAVGGSVPLLVANGAFVRPYLRVEVLPPDA